MEELHPGTQHRQHLPMLVFFTNIRDGRGNRFSRKLTNEKNKKIYAKEFHPGWQHPRSLC